MGIELLPMCRRREPHGISAGVSLVLLVSNIHRVQFWFGKGFSLVLLYQSIVMISVQLALLELACRLRGGSVEMPLGASSQGKGARRIAGSTLAAALISYTGQTAHALDFVLC